MANYIKRKVTWKKNRVTARTVSKPKFSELLKVVRWSIYLCDRVKKKPSTAL